MTTARSAPMTARAMSALRVRRWPSATSSALQPQEWPDPDLQARVRRDPPDRADDAGHEGRAVHRVVADRQGLTGRAEEDLLVSQQAAEPYAVYVDSVDDRTAGTGQLLHGRVRHVPEPGRMTSGSDHVRRRDSRTGRGVGLGRVVQLDDLRALVMLGRDGGEMHHQHRADRAVRGSEHADGRLSTQPGTDLVVAFVGEAGRADHHVQTVVDAPLDVVHDRGGMGEVDDDLCATRIVAVVPDVKTGDQVEVRARGDRAAHLSTHPTVHSEHCDAHATSRLCIPAQSRRPVPARDRFSVAARVASPVRRRAARVSGRLVIEGLTRPRTAVRAARLYSLSCSGLLDHGDERELATVIDLGDLDLELLADRQDVLDVLHAGSAGVRPELRDVEQAVLAGEQGCLLYTSDAADEEDSVDL